MDWLQKHLPRKHEITKPSLFRAFELSWLFIRGGKPAVTLEGVSR